MGNSFVILDQITQFMWNFSHMWISHADQIYVIISQSNWLVCLESLSPLIQRKFFQFISLWDNRQVVTRLEQFSHMMLYRKNFIPDSIRYGE